MATLNLKFDGLEEPTVNCSSSTGTGSEKQEARSEKSETSPATTATATAAGRLRSPASWLQSLHQKKGASSGNSSTSQAEALAFDKKVVTILRDYLEPEESSQLLSPETAVESILALLPASTASTASTASNYKGKAFAVASLCLEAAEQIRYHHPAQPKLAQLCAALATTPRFCITTPAGTSSQCFSQALKETLRDNFEGPYTDEPSIHWINYHAFLALLDHYCVWPPSSLYAIWAMRDAWEREPDDPSEKDCLAMAAAQWIVWRGQSLFQDMAHPRVWLDPDDRKLYAVGPLYTGPGSGDDVLSLARWRFWQRGFTDVAKGQNGRVGYSAECQALAMRVVDLMESLARSMLF